MLKADLDSIQFMANLRNADKRVLRGAPPAALRTNLDQMRYGAVGSEVEVWMPGLHSPDDAARVVL